MISNHIRHSGSGQCGSDGQSAYEKQYHADIHGLNQLFLGHDTGCRDHQCADKGHLPGLQTDLVGEQQSQKNADKGCVADKLANWAQLFLLLLLLYLKLILGQLTRC